ncbi:MAG TPA: hypothetical protein VEC38_07290 [Candidatus Binataceae bacterium]|nr:hypothetical protein [Candidatus Binataceae bacterium]
MRRVRSGLPASPLVAALGRAAIAFIPVLAVAAGCTSMGFDRSALRDSIDFGPPEHVRLCVYLDDGLAPSDATSLIDTWSGQARIFKLYVEPVSFQHMSRAAFFNSGILEQVNSIPLGPSCDRMIYFVNRNAGDVAYGLASIGLGLPEVLGEVDDPTLTHGYVVARRATVTQLLMSPSDVTEHELFHLLGCPDHFNMPGCYERIHNLKLAEEKLKQDGYFKKVGEAPFYPTFASHTESMLLSRAQVNRYSRMESGPGSAALVP